MISESVVKAIERGAERTSSSGIAGSETVVSALESGLNDVTSAVEKAADSIVKAIEKANSGGGGGGAGASFSAMTSSMAAGPEFGVYGTNEQGKREGKAKSKIEPPDKSGPSAGMVAASTALIGVWAKILSKSEALQGKSKKLGKTLSKTATIIAKAVAPALLAGADALIMLFEGFNNLSGPVQTFISVAFGVVSALTILGTAAMAAQAAIGTLSMSMLPVIGGAALLVAAVAGLYVAWQNNLFGIQTIAAQVFKWLKQQVAKFVSFVKPLWKSLVAGLRKLWKVHGKALVKEFTATMNSLYRTISWVIAVTKPIWKTGLKILAAVTKMVFSIIKTRVLTALDAIVTAVRVGLALLRGDWKKAGKIVLKFINRTVERIKGLVGRLGEIFGGLAESAVTWAKDLVKKFVAGLDEKKKALVQKANQFKQKVIDTIGGLADSAAQWGKDLVSEFISGIDDKIARFKSKINDIKNTVQEAISFDRVENDRMAQRWGSDLVEHFSRGMTKKSMHLQSALPSQKPGSFGLQPAGAGGGGSSVNVTVEAGAIQMRGGSTARVNAEKTADGVAEAFEQRLGRRS